MDSKNTKLSEYGGSSFLILKKAISPAVSHLNSLSNDITESNLQICTNELTFDNG